MSAVAAHPAAAPVSLPGRRPAVGAAALEELQRLEEELEAAWRRLESDGHGYDGVRATLADGTSDPEGGRPDDEERIRALREADAAQAAFLERLDDYQRRMHVHFMEQVVRELERAVETMTAFYGRRRLWRVRAEALRLERLARRYRELEPLYGTAQDHRRIAVYQRFYAGVVAFSRRIRALDPTMPRPLPPEFWSVVTRLARGLVTRVRRIPAALRVLWAGLRLVAIALARPGSETGTPFTRRIDALFRAWGEVRGHTVVVTGREHLPAPPGEVALYTPAHRQGTTDNVTFAHVALPDYCVFNAVDQLPIVPRFLKDRAARTPGLIAVGGGRGSAVERALEAVSSGVSRNLLIYPEGSVSEGFRGTRPPRSNFGEKLVRGLRGAGHRVRIVPITYLDNARFLDLAPVSARSSERRLRVVVSPPLESGMVDAALCAGGGAMVNRLVRLAWLEQLVTDERQLLGHDRVRAVAARLDDELDGIRYWGSLESAAVRDRLETRSGEAVAVREEPFRGKRVRVLRLPASAALPDGRIPLPDLADEDSPELVLGLRAPSHIYLNVGRRRFDGDIFRPLRVRERDYVYPGILVRFVGIPVKSLHAIRRELEELSGREYRTLTCANSACRLIARAANMEIDDRADMRPFLPSHVLPTRTIRKLIERGVRNHRGDRVEVQIYKTDDRPLEDILAGFRRAEIRIAMDHLELATKGAWRAVASGARRLLARGQRK